MKYVISGLGGVGGAVADQLAKVGRDVTAIARGAHLEAIKEQGGLRVQGPDGKIKLQKKIKACAEDEYADTPDVVFVCVKDYSLESVYPFLQRVCSSKTVVIPLSNVYKTGDRIAAALKESMGNEAPLVTHGCVYCFARIVEPGLLARDKDILRVIFGMPTNRDHVINQARLEAIEKDATVGVLECVCSELICIDHLRKFSQVSSMSVVCIMLGVTADAIRVNPVVRGIYINAVNEVKDVAAAMGLMLGDDLVDEDLYIADMAAPGSTTSLVRDLEAGRPSEIEGLIRSMVLWGVTYGVPTPAFKRASVAAHERYGV